MTNKNLEILKIKLSSIYLELFINTPLLNKYHLKKVNQFLKVVDLDQIKKITTKPLQNQRDINVDNDIKLYIEKFVSVMNENFDEEELENLNANIKWVQILLIKSLDKNTLGLYSSKTNEIKLIKDFNVFTLYHELLHLSASNLSTKNETSGFLYVTQQDAIGKSLNEGYTELLVGRYFIEDKKTQRPYRLERRFAANLEAIIGRKQMSKYYLKCDLFGLINAMKEYYTKEEIEKFLVGFDFVSFYMHTDMLISDIEHEAITDQTFELIKFLIKGYCMKLSKLNLLDEEKQKMLKKFFLNIKFPIDIDYDLLNSIVNKYLGDNIQLKKNTWKRI